MGIIVTAMPLCVFVFKTYLPRLPVTALCPLFFDYVVDGLALGRGFLLLFGRFFICSGFKTFKPYACKLQYVHYGETYDKYNDEIN